MTGYIVRRVLSMVPVALIVSMVLFGLIRAIPGDPVEIILGEQLTPQTKVALRHELGLDQPVPVQYVKWLSRVVRLDFGRSLGSRLPVRTSITERLPATLELAITGLAAAFVIAIMVGTTAAVFRDSVYSRFATIFSLVFISMPTFVLGYLLVIAFALRLHWLPTQGFVAFSRSPSENIRHLIMPATVIALFNAGFLARFVRSGLLETLYTDYIRTARAKGLAESAIVIRHAMRNALLPIVTIVGLTLGALWEGAVVVETVFSWPGIGRLAVDSFGRRDYPTVEAIVMIAAFTFMIANLLVDIAYAWLDPRISYGR